MLSVKLSLILLLQVISVFGLGNNALINLPELNEDNLNWVQDKIGTLNYLLTTLTDVGNVTLIGWQHIWNPDGTLKGIVTIELTLINTEPNDNAFDEQLLDLKEEIPVVMDVMNSLSSSVNIWAGGSFQQFVIDDLDYMKVNITPSSIHLYERADTYWMENIPVTSKMPIRNMIGTLKQQSHVPVGVLTWNLDGTLDKSASIIVPELLATVMSSSNATLWAARTAVKATAQGALLQPDRIPLYVSDFMKQNVPGYIWIVAGEIDSSFVNSEIGMTVSYQLDILSPSVEINIFGIPI